MTIEELLTAACAKGLTHLTMWPVPSADGKTTYWHARATPSTGHHYVSASGLNPADVLAEVLSSLPKAPKRAVTAAVKPRFDSVNPPISEMPQRAATPANLDPELEDWLPKT